MQLTANTTRRRCTRNPFALLRAVLSAHELHQSADGQHDQKRAHHAQRDGSAVMQQQNEKAHQKRKRQYVKARAKESLKQRRDQIQKRRVDPEASQHGKDRQKQAHERTHLPADRPALAAFRG